MARGRAPLRIAGIVILALAGGAISTFLLLTRTSVGQAILLEAALRRVEREINGEILVSGIRSSGLHRGARLLGVRVNAPDGTPLLAADSLEAEYSMRGILRGDILLAGVNLWRPIVTITRSVEGEPFNVSAFLAGTGGGERARAETRHAVPEEGGEGATAPERGGRESTRPEGGRLVLEDLAIHEGSLDVRYPLPDARGPGSRIVTVPLPDGKGTMRSLAFRGIDTRVERVSIVDPELEGLQVDVNGLAMEGEVFRDPVRVEDFVGRIHWLGDRIEVFAERLALRGTEARGGATVDLREGSGPELTLDLEATRLDLADLRWLQPTLPDVQGSGALGVTLGPGGLQLRSSGMRFDVDGGAVVAEGVLDRPRAGEASLADVSVAISGLPVPSMAEYLPWMSPLGGTIDGAVVLSGPLEALAVRGGLALSEPAIGPSRGDLEGVLHLRGPVGATDLRVRFTPIDLSIANRLAEWRWLDGAMHLNLRADGRIDEGVEVMVDAVYLDPDSEESHISVEGTFTRGQDDLFVSLDGLMEPFSLAGLVRDGSPLSRLGAARGTIRAEGPLSSMTVTTTLATGAGQLALEGRFDARSPLRSYRLAGSARDFDAFEALPTLPEGTVLSGSLDLRGEGTDLGTGTLAGDVQLTASRFAHLQVDAADLGVRVADGVLTVDTIQTTIGGVEIRGAGRLAVTGAGSAEQLHVRIESDNIEGLRPLLLGPDVTARDTLSALELGILTLEGIDPDTLPILAQVLVSGAVDGRLTLAGSVEELDVSGQARVRDGLFGSSRIGEAELSFSAPNLLSPRPDVQAQIDAIDVRVLERVFDSVSVRLEYQRPRGSADLLLVTPEEDYRARMALEREDERRTLHLDELVLRFPGERWNLGGPATLSWDPDGVTVRDLRVIRPGVGGMRVRAQGRLPFRGQADFELSVDRLDVARIADLLQMSERLEGMVDVGLLVTGSAEDPAISGIFSAEDFRFREYEFDRLLGTWDHEDRTAIGGIELWRDSVQVLTVNGKLPLDLAFQGVQDRVPDEPIDLVVVSQQLPLSLVVAPFEGYRDASGTLSGRVELGGTPESVAPRGRLTVADGAVFLAGVGVRHEDLNGTLNWFPDGRIEIDSSARASGTGRVQGTVILTPVSDPRLDLEVSLDGFQGIDREDVTARLSGDIRVQGSYRRPVVSGSLLLDEGTLFVEEFQRAAQVVDLSDPAFYDVVDTEVMDLRPLLAGQNPFLRNIRMENMTLTVQRNSWIRSDRMDVELDGELQVLYDRLTQDLAMMGTLEAVRGSYEAFGRRFQVDGGTLRFLGTPGINPDLNIQASNRIRSAAGDRFTISATVTGSLVSPRIGLTSDQVGLSEDDLLSYLYFGRPTYALTSGQAQTFGAAGALLGSGVTLGLRTFGNRLGSVVAEELFGVDYLSITQEDLWALGDEGLRGTLGTTVVETGFYLADDFFVTLLLRPLSRQDTGSRFAGIRFEWAAPHAYTIESFFEDRFSQGRVFGFGELGIRPEKGLGLSIFREWGY